MAAKTAKSIDLKEIKAKDLKPIAVPALTLFGLLLLTIIAFNAMSQKISSQKTLSDKAKRNENILIEKQRVLAEFDIITTEEVGALTSVLPEKYSTLMMLSQIKTIAQNQGVSFTNLSVSPVVKTREELYKAEMKFDIDGSITSVIQFIKTLENYAPIKTINSAKFINSGGLTRGEISISVYSAPFPTKIPAITDAVKSLTPNEIEMLAELSNLVLPSFTELTPQTLQTRTNPFE